MLLADKKVLVTGGSRGIGRAICAVFAREGADVAFCYASDERAAAETEAAVRAHGRDVLAVRADVGDRAAAGAFVAAALDRFTLTVTPDGPVRWSLAAGALTP